jgi:hypothetical protein
MMIGFSSVGARLLGQVPQSVEREENNELFREHLGAFQVAAPARSSSHHQGRLPGGSESPADTFT